MADSLGITLDSVQAVKKLRGLTNRSYLVTTETDNVVVRIPHRGLGDSVDRDVERHNATAASTLGLGPELLASDTSTGLLVTRYVDLRPFVSLSGPFGIDELRIAASSLRRLHESGLQFRGYLELPALLDSYASRANQSGPIPELTDGDRRAALHAARQAAVALSLHEVQSVPCHNDPTPDNMCGRAPVVLVDWEYSCSNDPAWDVVYFELAAGLSSGQTDVWRAACLGHLPTAAEAERLALYRVALDVLCGLWSSCQAPESDEKVQLLDDARLRFARALSTARAEGIS